MKYLCIFKTSFHITLNILQQLQQTNFKVKDFPLYSFIVVRGGAILIMRFLHENDTFFSILTSKITMKSSRLLRRRIH